MNRRNYRSLVLAAALLVALGSTLGCAPASEPLTTFVQGFALQMFAALAL
ncbi:MAG: hypothetical protein HY763_02395 [Planctomycetes bacterium]|nr:hypothetical protein [Planctomycetota bacterium]